MPGADAPPETLCRALFARVDAAVEAADVVDAGAARIDGFAWLRVTRPLASFRDEVDTEPRFRAWIERLAAADRSARRHELANLPDGRRAGLAEAWRGRAAEAGLPARLRPALAECRERLNRDLVTDVEARERLRAAAVVPDAYVGWQRILGLYPVARRIARARIADFHARRAAVFGDEPAHPLRGYAVPGERIDGAARLVRGLRRDALGIPEPSATTRARLFAAHAPLWSVATASDADRPGALVVDDSGRLVADPDRPAEYRRLSWTRFHGDVLVQLSYVVWFPERPAQGAFDLLAGHLDAVIWRVTLGPAGRPLAYDSMHACGCFYMLFPAPGWDVAAVPSDQEPVASPRAAPRVAAGERLRVRLEAGTHYIDALGAIERPADARPLAPMALQRLRSLPGPGGGNASAFDEDGLIASSARTERFVFWPLGVPSAGAMRQWGTHAIAFVGRRYFDDPYLLQQLLERDEQR